MPRPRHLRTSWRSPRTPVVALVAATLALAGCSTAAGTGGTGEPVAYDVPAVPVQVTAPPGWERVTHDGAFVLRAPSGSGPADFRASVVVTGERSGATLEQAGAETAAALDAIPGWTPGSDGQGPTTLAELPAFRVAGTYDAAGTVVAQEVVVLRSGDGPDSWLVDLTASYAADDADGAAQARAILESVRLTDAG